MNLVDYLNKTQDDKFTALVKALDVDHCVIRIHENNELCAFYHHDIKYKCRGTELCNIFYSSFYRSYFIFDLTKECLRARENTCRQNIKHGIYRLHLINLNNGTMEIDSRVNVVRFSPCIDEVYHYDFEVAHDTLSFILVKSYIGNGQMQPVWRRY